MGPCHQNLRCKDATPPYSLLPLPTVSSFSVTDYFSDLCISSTKIREALVLEYRDVKCLDGRLHAQKVAYRLLADCLGPS
jgi:hypothetical protein